MTEARILPPYRYTEDGGTTAAHHSASNLDEPALVPGLKLAANQLLDSLDRHRQR